MPLSPLQLLLQQRTPLAETAPQALPVDAAQRLLLNSNSLSARFTQLTARLEEDHSAVTAALTELSNEVSSLSELQFRLFCRVGPTLCARGGFSR
jgi:hypothetical protein